MIDCKFLNRPWVLWLMICASVSYAQLTHAAANSGRVVARLAVVPTSSREHAHTSKAIPAVIWLNPLQPGISASASPGNFTLLQKDKMFLPHLLVVPIGSSVAFPNADPFFHNVFSLFDGRRFDLGLYEAGSTRRVVFSREGVSYIFCNIHSEMSAVVISLSTRLYSVADSTGAFHLTDVPPGDYDLHVWIEGQRQTALDHLTRRVHIAGDSTDLGEIHADHPESAPHLNKFGRPYEPDANPIY